jgi:hypothetical protein
MRNASVAGAFLLSRGAQCGAERCRNEGLTV